MSTKSPVKPAKPEVTDVKKADVIIDVTALEKGQPTNESLQTINNMIDAVASDKKRKPRKSAKETPKPANGTEDNKSVSGSETPSQIERKKRSANVVTINDSENRGIIISPNKIRKIIKSQYIDPANNEVLKRLADAENQKDEKGNPAPVELRRLQANVHRVIQQAEAEYMMGFMRDYEREVVKSYDDVKKADYDKKRAAEIAKYHETYKIGKYTELDIKQNGFDAEKFNRSYDSHFYDKFDAYYAVEDKYAVGKTYIRKGARSGTETKRTVTEHYRATMLIRRRMKRLNVGVATIVAAYLDYLITTLHEYCIGVAFSEAVHNTYITLDHVIKCATSDNSPPIMRFLSTFDNYRNAVQYIKTYKAADSSQRKNMEFNKPDAYTTDFAKKIGDICNVVRKKLGGAGVTEVEKHATNCKMTSSYKAFLGCIIYEAVSRISRLLLEEVNSKDVRTINHDHAWLVLRQIHTVCNIRFDDARTAMKEKISKNAEWMKALKKTNAISRLASRDKVDKLESVSEHEAVVEEDHEETSDEEANDLHYETEA